MTATVPVSAAATAESPQGPLVSLEHISKRFGAVQALSDVSLQIGTGEILGLCGHNGAGKSTLVKVLAGLVAPDSGSVSIGGSVVRLRSPRDAQAHGIAVVEQELSIVGALTVQENLLLGRVGEPFVRRPRADTSRARQLLAQVGLKLDPNALVERLTLGQRQLIEIARALGREARLIILDEPTATLSEMDIEAVFSAVRRLAATGCSVVFVSHRLSEVLRLCSRVAVMRDGENVATLPTRSLREDTLVTMMLGHVPTRSSRPATPAATEAEPRLRIHALAIHGRLAPLDLDVLPGEICGLAGQVGSGASELLRALAGLEPAAVGTVIADGRQLRLGSPRRAAAHGVAFVSNDRKLEGMFPGQEVGANLTATRLPAFTRAGILQAARLRAVTARLAALVAVPAGRLRQRVLALSGGNQQKVLIARCLERDDVRVLLLDEPTRGVDVGGRSEIHTLVRRAADHGVAVLFSSTELNEIMDVADTVVTMRSGRLLGRLPRADVTHEGVLADMTHRESA